MRKFLKNFFEKKIYRVAFTFLTAFFIIAATLFIKKTQAQAQTSGTLPFGGQIEDVEYCCDGSVLLTIGPPDVGFYDYRPGASQLFEYYDVFAPGPWVLGTATPGGACDLTSGDCETTVNANTIRIIGTSSQ